MSRCKLLDPLYLVANIRTVSLFVFVSIASIGCIWQFISLVQLYLTYPTTVQIDTQFDVHKDSLAAFTLCKNVEGKKTNHLGKSSDDLFEYYSKLKSIEAMHLEGPDIDFEIDSLVTRVDKLSLSHTCSVRSHLDTVSPPLISIVPIILFD